MSLILLGIGIGIVGSTLGCIITLIIGKRSEKVICCLLAFAGGIMCAVSFFKLIPEAIKLIDVYISGIGILFGVIIVLLLNKLIDNITKKNDQNHETLEELHHQSMLIEDVKGNRRMFKSGILMLIVITLHNIPEGVAIGAAGSFEYKFGFIIAIIIAIHNIPEGMAISTPLLVGDMKKGKILLWSFLAGLPTFIGGIIGFYIGGISNIFQALCLSIAAGAMLYIVFGEIIPQSISNTKSRLPTIVALVGIIVGLLVTLF